MSSFLPPPSEHVVPIEQLRAGMMLDADSLKKTAGRDGELWMLHQAVFDARMSALREMTRQGKKAVRPPRVTVRIEVMVDTIPDDAPFDDVLRDDESELRFYSWP